jgi:hypothetical protein
MKRGASLVAIISVLFLSASPIAAQGSISLDHVDGMGEPGEIIAGQTVRFHLRLTNGSAFDLMGSTNGFRFYSTDGGVWSPIVADSANIGWGEIFDGGLFFTPGSVTGSGADTILDSSFYPPAGYWFWSHSTNGNSVPSWDGPHCFVAAGCCVGIRGNVNGDAGDVIDISDLVYLVDYMFADGPEPPCFDEGNINGDGATDIDISDLVHLVDYMFTDGPPPADCF